jgi:hypothetical protein
MRSAVLQLADTRTTTEHRDVLQAAARQLERADIYLAAVASMELDDPDAQRAVRGLRANTESLRRHLAGARNRTSE